MPYDAMGNYIPDQMGMAGPQGQLKQDTSYRGEAFPVIDMAEGRERGIAGSWVLDASGELRQRNQSRWFLQHTTTTGYRNA
jgi:hypothetical protein